VTYKLPRSWLRLAGTAKVRAVATSRVGGVSRLPFDTFNLDLGTGNDPAAADENRA
jgi:copper oxidase (laccase) domain-containing protein